MKCKFRRLRIAMMIACAHLSAAICVTGLAALFVITPAGGRNSSAEAQESGTGQQLSSAPDQSQTTFNFARSLAADAAGRVHAVWHTTQDGRSQVYYRRSPQVVPVLIAASRSVADAQ